MSSKFSEVVADCLKTAVMRSTLPKDILEKFFDEPFHYEGLRNCVSACFGERLVWRSCEQCSSTYGHRAGVDKSEGEDGDVNAVQQRRTVDQPSQKHKLGSDNERKPIEPWDCHFDTISVTTSRLYETRNRGVMRRDSSAGKKQHHICYRLWWKGAILPGSCPSADDCQDVDDVGTEPSSDA